jgi:hypothetical protein
MKHHLKKIDTSFHQPLPNMVQRLFADDTKIFRIIKGEDDKEILQMISPN